jgi:hypothetical protein
MKTPNANRQTGQVSVGTEIDVGGQTSRLSRTTVAARLTALPPARSHDMYAAAPRMRPACVAGTEIVGDMVACARPEATDRARLPGGIQQRDRAVCPQLDVRPLQIVMDDPRLVRRLQRLHSLLRDRQHLVNGNRNLSRSASVARQQFHHERVSPRDFSRLSICAMCGLSFARIRSTDFIAVSARRRCLGRGWRHEHEHHKFTGSAHAAAPRRTSLEVWVESRVDRARSGGAALVAMM